MTSVLCNFLLVLSGVFQLSGAEVQEPAPLFDGASLEGWETPESDSRWWSVDGGRIRGGSLEEDVPHNTFLATQRSYQNFELRLSIRLEGSGGLVNSGIQIRSTRVDGSSEMSGYQVDVGDGWWGKLYDESRRNRVIAEPLDPQALELAVTGSDWKHYRILAEGPRIRSWINGVPALDYTEVDGGVPLDGKIAIQVHSGGRVLVEVKDLTLLELPATPGAMSWRRFEKARSVSGQGKAPVLDAAEELAGFQVLEGFEVELVTADPLVNKVVDIAFDDAGRMWAVTALEYPLDGNESDGVAERYASGGRDQVLVFDDPWQEGPLTPRVFADGLFMPMAISPRSDGVLIGMGSEILRLHDDDSDGKADRREVVLSGFGIQDSHLLPHRFVRAPGDWTYLAQGAFNSSQVVTKNGLVVKFDRCKIGRFKSDGSRFEVVGIGLNNIWGLVIDRLGDRWIQEANDLGYPLVPFEHYRSYPGIGMDRFHSHSPWHPPHADFQMGGTGLSGLALSEDAGGFPAPWDETFFLANPIISSVQSIRAQRDPLSPSEVKLERARDLLTSDDKNFRPVAVHFGPDGCLYVVDWYNPIISHNEVPRDHPDRDRTSSRIWRIRHASQPRQRPVDVSARGNDELVELLGAGSTWAARAAWHQIGERRAVELEEALVELALDRQAPARDRILALWCLQDLNLLRPRVLAPLVEDQHHALRRESARLSKELGLDSERIAEFLEWTASDRDPRVRLAAIHSLGEGGELAPRAVGLLLEFVHPLPEGPVVWSSQLGAHLLTGRAGDLAFERSLVRAVLEARPADVFEFLDSEHARDLDERLQRFALLCAGGAQGARRLALLLTSSGTVPSALELPFLALHGSEPEVREAVTSWISRPETRPDGLRMLADSELRWEENPTLTATVIEGLRAQLLEDSSRASQELLLRVARERRLVELEPDVIEVLDGGGQTLACLQALLELGSTDAELFGELAASSLPDSELRRVACTALARVQGADAFEVLLELWPELDSGPRAAALAALLESSAGATRLLSAIMTDEIGKEVLDARVLTRLSDHLGEDANLALLRDQVAALQQPVLRLEGGGEDYADTKLVIEGPFTVEAWIRLDQGIGNEDGLLLSPGAFDLNFYDARLRLWLGPAGDVIISSRQVVAEQWLHFALTRAADGRLSLYLNGELDISTHPESPARFEQLDVGRTGPAGGTAAEIFELRLWSMERSAAEVGAGFRRRFDPASMPDGLELVIPGADVKLSGAARFVGALDMPPVLSEAEVLAEEQRFERYRALALAGGDVSRGRQQFLTHCSACHRVGGEGTSIGPVLDGVGAKGTEGLLRSILTPNAGVESGYRTLIVRTTDGEILDGFLASEDSDSILLRRKDREDLRLPRHQIESARFDRLSLMPEGLLDALEDQEVSDLFSYLMGLN
jgi:putative membrane-bound dehydrogenase-like protein